LGIFATAIDKAMEEREYVNMDVFFGVVARWAGIEEDEEELDHMDDGEDGDLSQNRGTSQGVSGFSGGVGSSNHTTRSSDVDDLDGKESRKLSSLVSNVKRLVLFMHALVMTGFTFCRFCGWVPWPRGCERAFGISYCVQQHARIR